MLCDREQRTFIIPGSEWEEHILNADETDEDSKRLLRNLDLKKVESLIRLVESGAYPECISVFQEANF